MADTDQEIAWLCRQLPGLRRLAKKNGPDKVKELDNIVEIARQQGEFKDRLIELAHGLGIAVDDLMAFRPHPMPAISGGGVRLPNRAMREPARAPARHTDSHLHD
jgi:hypothetical protein